MDTSNVQPADEQPPIIRGRDRGFTLSEVIVAIALTGVLVLTIIAAGWTLIRVSTRLGRTGGRRSRSGGGGRRTVAVRLAELPEETLNYDVRVGEAASRIDWPSSSVTVSRIEYWDITTGSWSGVNPFVNTDTGLCGPVPTTAAASRMQQVAVRASAPGGTHAHELQVVVAEIRFLDEQDNA